MPKKAKKVKKQFVFELAIPVKTTWIFHVVASSKKEAWEKYNNPTAKEVEQNCEIGGWQHGRRPKVIRKTEYKTDRFGNDISWKSDK